MEKKIYKKKNNLDLNILEKWLMTQIFAWYIYV